MYNIPIDGELGFDKLVNATFRDRQNNSLPAFKVRVFFRHGDGDSADAATVLQEWGQARGVPAQAYGMYKSLLSPLDRPYVPFSWYVPETLNVFLNCVPTAALYRGCGFLYVVTDETTVKHRKISTAFDGITYTVPDGQLATIVRDMCFEKKKELTP